MREFHLRLREPIAPYDAMESVTYLVGQARIGGVQTIQLRNIACIEITERCEIVATVLYMHSQVESLVEIIHRLVIREWNSHIEPGRGTQTFPIVDRAARRAIRDHLI